jgi:hypothetical protein
MKVFDSRPLRRMFGTNRGKEKDGEYRFVTYF